LYLKVEKKRGPEGRNGRGASIKKLTFIPRATKKKGLNLLDGEKVKGKGGGGICRVKIQSIVIENEFLTRKRKRKNTRKKGECYDHRFIKEKAERREGARRILFLAEREVVAILSKPRGEILATLR